MLLTSPCMATGFNSGSVFGYSHSDVHSPSVIICLVIGRALSGGNKKMSE